MKIIEILADHRTKVLLADGRSATLSSLNKSQTRKIVLENGQEVGIIQKLYVTATPQIVYLITEGRGKDVKIYLEFMDDPDDMWLEDKAEIYMEILDLHRWILEIPNGTEVFEKLVKLSAFPYSLSKLLEGVKEKTLAGQTRGVEILKDMIHLIENPELRDQPKHHTFWQDTCLVLCKQLGIKV